MLTSKEDPSQCFLTVHGQQLYVRPVILWNTHTNTGGSIVMRAFGSTGCAIFNSSSASVEILELDLTRLEVVV